MKGEMTSKCSEDNRIKGKATSLFLLDERQKGMGIKITADFIPIMK